MPLDLRIKDPRIPDVHPPKPTKHGWPGPAKTKEAPKSNHHRQTSQDRAYKTQNRSAAARADYLEAKAHFHQAGKDFRIGVCLAVSAVKSVPYLLGEKRARRRFKACEAIQRREMKERRQQDKKLAKERAALRPAQGGGGQLHVGGDGFI